VIPWQPGAGLEALRTRARVLDSIRGFFRTRGVLEVETPALCRSGITDPAIEPLVVTGGGPLDAPRYLQTSPEYAMKRLLAAGSGPIFQIAPAFRAGEAGARHNPEFSLLEWYRPGMDHHELMAEVAELVNHCLGARTWRKVSYRQLFLDSFGVDPHTAPDYDLRDCAASRIDVGAMQGDRDLWLDLLMSHLAGPRLGSGEMVFVYDYPASRAALARIAEVDGVPVGHRFELYLDGLELANGYLELTDPVEQRARFERDNRRRAAAGQPERPLDEALLAALEAGLPDCSGVALGVDRLLMLLLGEDDIRRVLAFDWERA
jgi:lysyl-tRNA synthetase class 2